MAVSGAIYIEVPLQKIIDYCNEYYCFDTSEQNRETIVCRYPEIDLRSIKVYHFDNEYLKIIYQMYVFNLHLSVKPICI